MLDTCSKMRYLCAPSEPVISPTNHQKTAIVLKMGLIYIYNHIYKANFGLMLTAISIFNLR